MATKNDDGMTGDQKVVLVTKEGLDKLKEELEYLKNVRRREVAARIKEAVSYGDLSENSEYEESKNEQAFVEGRIIELEDQVKHAKIISEKHKTQAVEFGSTVTVENLTKGGKEVYTIVGTTETDPFAGKISNESPIGAALLEHLKGEEVLVKAPMGEVSYKILEIK